MTTSPSDVRHSHMVMRHKLPVTHVYKSVKLWVPSLYFKNHGRCNANPQGPGFNWSYKSCFRYFSFGHHYLSNSVCIYPVLSSSSWSSYSLVPVEERYLLRLLTPLASQVSAAIYLLISLSVDYFHFFHSFVFTSCRNTFTPTIIYIRHKPTWSASSLFLCIFLLCWGLFTN